MPIRFPCACGEQLEVDDAQAGQKARCPYCNAVADVPAETPSPRAKRAKLADPDDTHDDRGAYASSLNPRDNRNRPSSRRDRDDDEDEDDRPRARRRNRDDDEDEDEDDRPRRRSRAYESDDDPDEDYRPSRRRRRHEPPPYNLFNKQVVGGAVMIVIGVTVTVGLLFVGYIWWWMLILSVVGVFSLIRGLATGRDG